MLDSLLPQNSENQQKSETRPETGKELANLITNCPDGIIVLKKDGSVGYANPAAEQLLGISLEKLCESPRAELRNSANTGKFVIQPPGEPERVLEVRPVELEWEGEVATALYLRDITVQSGVEQRRVLLEAAVQHSNDGITITDADLDNPGPHIIFVNPAFTEMTGYSPEEAIGKTPRILQGPKTERKVLDQLRENLSKGERFFGEAVNYRKDGTEFYTEWHISPIRNAEGQITNFVAIKRDITGRKQAEEALQASEARLKGILDIADDAIICSDDKQVITLFNTGAEKLFGYKSEEVIGQPLDILLPERVVEKHRQHFQNFENSLENSRKMGERRKISARRKDGLEFPAEASISKFISFGQMVYTVILRDVSERKQLEELLERQAYYDKLTDLPNRILFKDRLEQALERSKRKPEYSFAVLFLDLDRFKIINDSLGHAIGDVLLFTAAQRLKSSTRHIDTVARLGGDEFTVLLDDIHGLEDATQIAGRILHELSIPYSLGGHQVFTTASIGIALGGPAYEKPEDLLRDADTAMYRAKTLGKGRYAIFDTDMHERVRWQLQMENELRRAVEREELALVYQPIFSLETHLVAGFEAFLRWQHPRHGLILPDAFVPLAEETGLIMPISVWVVREACRKARELQAQLPAEQPFWISVNLSGKQLLRAGLAEEIEQILNETGLDPQYFRLDINESSLVHNTDTASVILDKLKELGVKSHIDNFGTGFSSLSYLLRYPIEAIKIDRSLIGQMDLETRTREIVRTIIILAHNLGIPVIAQGVETAEQLAHLILLRCQYAQGNFLSPAEPDTPFKLMLA